ncbi:MAG: ATP-grasp domain-containing protein, partial [Planctomycetaceae bacterium]|nr:ATP-grasp domain-containing protein [Planctomycetaceae bacterium]
MPTAFSPGSPPSEGEFRQSLKSGPQVLIVGASARAAAFSALRSGFRPTCIDQFADQDLIRVCETVRVKDYPGGMVQQAERSPGLPVIYTGGLENHPQIVRQLSATRPILGNDWQTLAAVRDPIQVYEALKRVKVPCLSVRAAHDPPRPDGTWLRKPVHGAGGRGIIVWDQAMASSAAPAEPHYYQRRAKGESISAVFLASQDPFSIRYVGLTRQLVGMSELNAQPFGWCGSIGPIVADVAGEILIRRTGSVIAHQFGLRGLFGCDFILESPDRPLLTEVNPRYTSSVEVL